MPGLERFLRTGCWRVSEAVPFREDELPGWLAGLGLLAPGENAAVERAGDGNINWVRRVRSLASASSYVVKQARPALEKFPEYRVATWRIVCEARWFASVAPFDHDGICPRVHHFDSERRALVLEDLGDAETLAARLARGGDATAAAAALGGFLGRVHAGTRDPALARGFENEEMRRLHGEHIFVLPFRPNDFPLSPELRARAARLAAETRLIERIDAAYARYLTRARALLHADVQPTNVLCTSNGVKLLDAEIAHVGDPAFDVGQLVGHLELGAIARGDERAGRAASSALWSAYADAVAGELDVRFDEVSIFAGIEMLRRTLGAARVAEVASDAVALRVIAAARERVLSRLGDPSLL